MRSFQFNFYVRRMCYGIWFFSLPLGVTKVFISQQAVKTHSQTKGHKVHKPINIGVHIYRQTHKRTSTRFADTFFIFNPGKMSLNLALGLYLMFFELQSSHAYLYASLRLVGNQFRKGWSLSWSAEKIDLFWPPSIRVAFLPSENIALDPMFALNPYHILHDILPPVTLR